MSMAYDKLVVFRTVGLVQENFDVIIVVEAVTHAVTVCFVLFQMKAAIVSHKRIPMKT